MAGLVHGLAQFHRRLAEGLDFALDGVDIVAFQGFAQIIEGVFNRLFIFLGDLVAEFPQVFLARVDQGIRLVAGIDQLPALFVFLGMLLGFLDHALDIAIGQSPRSLDTDLLFLAGGLVLGRNVDNAIGIDVEGDFDLRHAAHRRRDTDQIELPQKLVVGGHFPLALENADGDRRLAVLGSGEHLAFARRNGGVSVDQAGEDAAQGLDAQTERGDVEKQDVLDVAGEDTALNGGADSHHFVGVDAFVGLAAEKFLDRFVDLGHAGHAADKDDFADLAGRKPRILECLFAGFDGFMDQILDQGFQFGAGQLDVEVFGAALIGGDER